MGDVQVTRPGVTAGFLAAGGSRRVQPMPEGSFPFGSARSGMANNASPATYPSTSAPTISNTSGMGSGTISCLAILGTVLCCCGLVCCLLTKLCGCLVGGAEDLVDGDGQLGEVGMAEEAVLAGAAGYKL